MAKVADEGVELDLDEPVRKTTAMAVLIKADGDEHWLPRSQVHKDSSVAGEDIEEGEEGPIIVTTWWAEKTGFA